MNLLKPLVGNLGRDADNPATDSDLAFFDWIAGTEDHSTVVELLLWLIEDLKQEKDPDKIRSLLKKWRENNDDQEFSTRLILLEKLMPSNHSFHKIKKEFE